MKKILIVSSSLSTGGLEKCLINLCNAIDYSAYTVDLYLFNEGRELLPQLNKNVHLLSDSPLYATVYNMPVLSSLKKLFKQKRFDLLAYRIFRFVRARFKMTQMSVSDWKYMKRTMLKIDDEYDVAIGFEEEASCYYVADCVKAKVKSCFVHTDIKKIHSNRQLDIHAFNKADYVCTVSENSKNSLMEFYPQFAEKFRLFMLPAIYDYDKINALSEEDCLIDNSSLSIVSIGRLVELKGFHLCVEALSRLLDDGYDVKWYVAGEGDYRSEIEKLIDKYQVSDNFILLGNCKNPYSYINCADICVQPSSYEGFSVAVWEEKYLKKPVVATNIPSNYEILTDGVNGYLIERNSDAIYNSVKKLIDNPDMRKSMGESPVNHFATKDEIMEDIYRTFSV